MLSNLDLHELLEKELATIEKLCENDENRGHLMMKMETTRQNNNEVEMEIAKPKEIDVKLGAIFNNIRQSKLKNEQNCFLKQPKKKNKNSQRNIDEFTQKQFRTNNLSSSSGSSSDEILCTEKFNTSKKLEVSEETRTNEMKRNVRENRKSNRHNSRTRKKTNNCDFNSEKGKHLKKSIKKAKKDVTTKEEASLKPESLLDINSSNDSSPSFLNSIINNDEGVYRSVFDKQPTSDPVEKSDNKKVCPSTLEKLKQFKYDDSRKDDVDSLESLQHDNIRLNCEPSLNEEVPSKKNNVINKASSSQSSHSQSIFSVFYNNSDEELDDLEF